MTEVATPAPGAEQQPEGVQPVAPVAPAAPSDPLDVMFAEDPNKVLGEAKKSRSIAQRNAPPKDEPAAPTATPTAPAAPAAPVAPAPSDVLTKTDFYRGN